MMICRSAQRISRLVVPLLIAAVFQEITVNVFGCADPFGLHCIQEQWSCPLENFKQHVTDTRCVDGCCQCTVLELNVLQQQQDGTVIGGEPPQVRFTGLPMVAMQQQVGPAPNPRLHANFYGNNPPQVQLIPLTARTAIPIKSHNSTELPWTLANNNTTEKLNSTSSVINTLLAPAPTTSVKIRLCRYADLESSACFIANADFRCDYCVGGGGDSSIIMLPANTVQQTAIGEPWPWSSSTSTNFNYASLYGLGSLSAKIPGYNVGYVSRTGSDPQQQQQLTAAAPSALISTFNGRPSCVRQRELGLIWPTKREDNNCAPRKQIKLPQPCERYALLKSTVVPPAIVDDAVVVKSSETLAASPIALASLTQKPQTAPAVAGNMLSARLGFFPGANFLPFLPSGYQK